jgi:hypothetical protein
MARTGRVADDLARDKTMSTKATSVSDLLGKTMTSVVATYDTLTFRDTEGREYELYHAQDCCESVYIEDVCGELNDLVGSPLTMSEEVESDPPEGHVPSDYGSETWTFYRFATVKGYVTVRWFGSSNGYYSESVNFRETTE